MQNEEMKRGIPDLAYRLRLEASLSRVGERDRVRSTEMAMRLATRRLAPR